MVYKNSQKEASKKERKLVKHIYITFDSKIKRKVNHLGNKKIYKVNWH